MESKRKLIKDRKYYKGLFTPRDKVPKNIPSTRYYGLYHGIDLQKTEQGYEYWLKRYFWLAEQDIPGAKYSNSEPISEDDWAYLRSLDAPVDAFLEAPENKEFVV